FILTITNDEKEKLVSYGINPNKIKVSGIGIDNNEDVKGNGKKFREKYNIDAPYVLQISTQTHDKGSHHTIEAMKILWEKGVNIKLVLIGQILTDFESYLFFQKSYVFENTIILNYASEEDKNNAIEGCEVFVMPSKSDSFGLVYVESWLYRKPVIAAYCSGVTEVIDEGINGFLVPFGDYEMIAGYIYKLLKDKELAKKMGEEGYKKAVNNYLWDQRIKNFSKLIDSLKL
ncbi:MAG: glycosyltransferase family 4 protein, partial [Actinobacteria bacterium]|nr:glycosyltransferase family 4 protein [Actinomycetota bacterium]